MKHRTLTFTLTGLLCLGTLSASGETLQDVYVLALENDHQLKADQAALQAGKEALTLGLSGLLPQISATAQYSDSDQDSLGAFTVGDPAVTAEQDTETEIYSVSLTQPLFNLPAWFGYQRGKVLSRQAEAQFGADQQGLIVRVSEAYFNVLRAVDNLETAIAEEKALGHQLEQTRQRFDVGLTAITDVHEAQAAFDDATAVTLEARGNLGISFESLEVITGTPHDAIAPLQEKFPVVKPDPLERHDWVTYALKNNYALKVAKLSAEAARQTARAKKSEHLPKISGSYSYNYNDTDTDITVNSATSPSDRRVDGNTFSIDLSVPLYSGGFVSGERRQAHHQYMQNQELYNKAQRDTIQNARSLHLQVVTDVAQVKARRQAITSSLSALEATQAGYDVGTRNLVDVLVAQRTVYQARRNYSNALYDYVINIMRLKEVAGLLTPQDIKDLNQWINAANPVTRAKYEAL